jgi:O-succinylbenzoic acid--CoA ligase
MSKNSNGGKTKNSSPEKQLKDHPHAVWSTYGMTETLSHIALRRLNGPEASSWYTPFEGVGIRQNEDGCLVIDAPEVAESTLVTHDIVEIAADGRRFKVLGRKDNVICSGGIKIQIEEVERLLRPHLTAPFLVSKRPDKVLGEAVALLTEATDLAAIEGICRTVLPPYWRPRHYQHTGHLPLTETGKPARAEAERIIRDGSAGRQT